MKIVACGNINNSTVLEYKPANNNSGISCFRSFSIQSDRADEFVHKYNKQSAVLSKFCTGATILGFFAGLKSGKKLVSSVVKSFVGALVGFVASSYIAYRYNDKLMNEYDVKGFNC